MTANNYESARRKYPPGHPWRKDMFTPTDKIRMARAREKVAKLKAVMEKKIGG